MSKPLDTVKVLDLTRVMSGPYCTMLLADMGADVVKIEKPMTGDDGRKLGPPFINGESAYFLSVNRGKRSVTLNLRSPRGLQILRDLIAQADVLVENFRPGVMESLGCGYEDARATNPRLIFCSISGYGHTGPNAHLPGYDLVIQGEGGVMSLTGDPDSPPYKTGASQADILSGMMAYQGILLALLARNKTGSGQRIDISMLDCQVSLLSFQASIYLNTGFNPSRTGNRHLTVAPHETYRCSDGHITLTCGNDGLWKTFCSVVERPAWAQDDRFRTNADRVRHLGELNALLQPLMLERTALEWVTLLRTRGIPCGTIRSVGEACEDPHVRAREMIVTLPHPTLGTMRTTGIPVKLSETPGAITSAPPLLGEHTDHVLTEWLHMDEKTVDALRAAEIV